ncbi:hypothetical protein P3W53_13085 [Pseudomonas denitrificans (nom. rej.)]|nr:hypothetical protein [Pseudomonas denitrificans (nom. rej.)]
MVASTARTTTWPCSGDIDSCPAFTSEELLGQCGDGGFFRSLKIERIYLTRYASYQEVKTDLSGYVRFDHHSRRWIAVFCLLDWRMD